MPIRRVQGWDLSYEEQGAGDAIFLLHGLLMDSSMWEHQAAALRARNRVIAVDAPGHGASPPRPVGFSAEDEAEALVRLASELGVEGPAVWIGHSMGGMKALRIALAHPERVRALVLADAQPYPERPDAVAQYDALLEVVKAQGPSPDLAQVIGTIMFGAPFLATAEGERWVKQFASLDGFAIEGSARLVFDRGDVGPRMGEIAAPTLVVHGTDDTPIPIEVAREYAARLPRGTLVEVPGSGHTSPCEAPEVVTRAIESFLAGLA